MLELKDRETEYLLTLIRCAVKGEKAPDISGVNMDRLLEIARSQQVYCIVLPCLEDAGLLSEKQYSTWKNYKLSEFTKLVAMKSEFSAVEKQLEEQNIPYMLLKGSLIKDYYPKESMRQLADIDVLYDKSRRDELLKIMEKCGFTLYAWSDNSDDFKKEPYCTFEFHRELFHNEYDFYPDFSFVWNNAQNTETSKRIMKVEDLYLHSIAHMYKHNMLGGFGIRFIIDNYLLLEKSSNWDFEYINKKLKEMKLSEFECFMKVITYKVFNDEALEEEETLFLEHIFRYGVFGDSNKGIELLYAQFEKEHNSSSILKYILSRYMPKRDFMERTYPVLKDKPGLLPLYYIKRFFTKTLKSFPKAFNEIKVINKIKRK